MKTDKIFTNASNMLKKNNLFDKNIINFLTRNKIIDFNYIYDKNRNLSEFNKFAFFNDSIKNGKIDIYLLENFYKSFRPLILYFSKNNKNIFIKNMNSLLNDLKKIQRELSNLLYPYVFSFEYYLEKFLYMKVMFFEKDFNYILEKIDIKKIKNIFDKNNLIDVSKIIHKFSFCEKIETLKLLWNENFINLDELSNYNFIHKHKLNQLRKIIYKKDLSNKEKDEKIFNNIFIERIQSTRKYRNAISHLSDLIMEKEKVDTLFNYLNKQEDFLRNKIARKLIFDIKNLLENSKSVKKFNYLKKYFSKFLNYN
ncbi:MAG: hypothetical protein HPAVJP_4350 [Candidatus Hepatoplasma vulgare]|nr:MAG: hypothetical protein HPAVJP_4350 [Candidatus Hepatoplasma sp.]